MGLPFFIPPMLAVFGSPFDSEEYIFEIKWDGYRALLLCEGGAYRLMSRNSVLLNDHYPELAFLSRLPEGTVLDGELVAFVDGRPSFEALRSGKRGDALIAYYAFDILYKDFDPQMSLPLLERKEILASLVRPFVQERLSLNRVVDARGKAFFEEAKERGLEGVMAKLKQSPYLPGKRDAAWKKIKRSRELFCVIIGYMPGEHGDGFKSLIVASDISGELRYVGRVGTGFSHAVKDGLFESMRSLVVEKPCVPCPERGVWIKPELFCKVAYLEFTDAGMLRAPVFKSFAG